MTLKAPPATLRPLERLAWCLGRDDAARRVPPFVSSRRYRPLHRRRYREGYAAQLRGNAPTPALQTLGFRAASPR